MIIQTKHVQINIYTHETYTHIFTHTLLPLNAHKSKLINPLAAAVPKFSTNKIKMHHNYDILYKFTIYFKSYMLNKILI